MHEPSCTCPACGGEMRKVGEDVTEMLDYMPGRFKVIRHVRPAFSCRSCETIVQAPMPSLPIERGRPGAGPARPCAGRQVLRSPAALPAVRHLRARRRRARPLDAGRLGRQGGLLVAPLVEAIGPHVLAAEKLHADDTPVPVLAPGTGKTKTGRLWVYVRDERPLADRRRRRCVYRYSPDRKGEHPRAHLAGFRGFLHADGYAGFDASLRGTGGQPATVTEVACWAHVRRKFYDVHVATGSPIAGEALAAHRPAVRHRARRQGRPPDERRRIRQSTAVRVVDDLAAFLDAALARSPARASSPAPSATPSRAGPRSPAISTMAGWRSATTPPSAPSGRWRSAGRTICSPAPTAAACAPPPPTR